MTLGEEGKKCALGNDQIKERRAPSGLEVISRGGKPLRYLG